MSTSSAVPVRTRRVASRLRDLRRRSGLSAPEVSQALGISMSKISRMESGHRGLNTDDVAALLGLYRVPSREREEVLTLVRNGKSPNWWTMPVGPLEKYWEDFRSFESEATTLRCYETMIFPGLLQAPGYVTAIARALSPQEMEVDLHKLLAQRTARQTLLHSARRFEFLIEQYALERQVGSAETMHRQLERVSAVAARANVSVQIVPQSAGAHAGLDGPFLYLEFEEHADLVVGEAIGCASYIEDQQIVAERREALGMLRKIALPPDESLRLIDRKSDEWRRQS
ncbi:helix-turn-helix transcriptional regulator [Saccharopolyspora gregorii]|uniref:Helix-turn-helix transcriptional regulator n=1 Tax=Saccharopolyspora gregorii TaxID=33914 RepID=A0ABP6RUP6_9PSEU